MKTRIDFTLGVRPGGTAMPGDSWQLLYGRPPEPARCGPVLMTVFDLDIDLSCYLGRRVDEIIEFDRFEPMGIG